MPEVLLGVLFIKHYKQWLTCIKLQCIYFSMRVLHYHNYFYHHSLTTFSVILFPCLLPSSGLPSFKGISSIPSLSMFTLISSPFCLSFCITPPMRAAVSSQNNRLKCSTFTTSVQQMQCLFLLYTHIPIIMMSNSASGTIFEKCSFMCMYVHSQSVLNK